MFVFVEGGDRLPHSSALHHLEHFALTIPSGEQPQKVKHTELQKNSRVPFTNVYILNRFLLVLFKFYSQNTERSQFLQHLWLPPGKEYL